LVRFMAFKVKVNALKDSWFVFDGVLVALMIWETWILVFLYLVLNAGANDMPSSSILRIFRVFRLTRVARTARLLTSVPELMILAKGMFVAMRSVLAVLVLLTLVIYIFAIVFVELGVLDTVPTGMNFLLLQVVCGVDSPFIGKLLGTDWFYYVLFLLYILLANLTIMNMLIGILCDVVSTVADIENEEFQKVEMEDKLTAVAKRLDTGGRGTIKEADFVQLLQHSDMTQDLNEMGIDVVSLIDFATFVFQECTELTYNDFRHMVFQFRGHKNATTQDVMAVRKQLSMQLLALENVVRSSLRSDYRSEQHHEVPTPVG
jgi:hypothetical protein